MCTDWTESEYQPLLMDMQLCPLMACGHMAQNIASHLQEFHRMSKEAADRIIQLFLRKNGDAKIYHSCHLCYKRVQRLNIHYSQVHGAHKALPENSSSSGEESSISATVDDTVPLSGTQTKQFHIIGPYASSDSIVDYTNHCSSAVDDQLFDVYDEQNEASHQADLALPHSPCPKNSLNSDSDSHTSLKNVSNDVIVKDEVDTCMVETHVDIPQETCRSDRDSDHFYSDNTCESASLLTEKPVKTAQPRVSNEDDNDNEISASGSEPAMKLPDNSQEETGLSLQYKTDNTEGKVPEDTTATPVSVDIQSGNMSLDNTKQ